MSRLPAIQPPDASTTSPTTNDTSASTSTLVAGATPKYRGSTDSYENARGAVSPARVPQEGQKRAPVGSVAPQRGHSGVIGISPGCSPFEHM